jgi:hypothetical protein
MANKPAHFRQFHVTRAIRGLAAAGSPNPSVEFHLPDGSRMVASAGGKLDVAPKVRKARPAARARPMR